MMILGMTAAVHVVEQAKVGYQRGPFCKSRHVVVDAEASSVVSRELSSVRKQVGFIPKCEESLLDVKNDG